MSASWTLAAGDNRLKKICRKFVVFSESWFVKHLLRPVIFLLPPTVVTAVATKQGLNKEIVEILGPRIGEFFNNSALVILVGAYLYVVVVKALFAAVRSYSKPARELQVHDLLAVFKALSIVVGDKAKRMSSAAQKALTKEKSHIKASEIFKEITRPDQQIPLLVKGLITIFEYIDDSNAKFRSGLMRVVDDKPVEWYAFEPIHSPPRTSIEDLRAPTSTINRCIKRKQMVVVEDIQKELRKKSKDQRDYVKGSTQPRDNGSQLCYPIIHAATRKVEYVLCVAGNKAECLKQKHAELYEWIIDHFDMRISMEHSLLILKEKTDEEKYLTA
jgi:hypothetical protein